MGVKFRIFNDFFAHVHICKKKDRKLYGKVCVLSSNRTVHRKKLKLVFLNPMKYFKLPVVVTPLTLSGCFGR